jgi:demethylmenaquinone methyltransferase/2-methoxy-6-polyprenyl-1,4-benzoquinol methylase
MSTYIWMKILESAPSRYDLGIRIITLGRLDAVYDHVADRIEEVMDLGGGRRIVAAGG